MTPAELGRLVERLDGVGVAWCTEADFAALLTAARELEALKEAMSELSRGSKANTNRHVVDYLYGRAAEILTEKEKKRAE